ncbi:MAG: hypothetical protein R8G66_08540 [Cytophagales bacterium]|nr:hypothetical protein [Cytophagales bacterium]
MNQEETLQKLLLQKYQRQKQLNEQFKDLEKLELDLSAQKFGRFFGTSYLVTKRLITLIIGVLITALGLLLLIQPDLIITDSIVNELVDDVAKEQMEMADELIQDAHEEVYEDRQLHLYEFRALMNPILNYELEEDLHFLIHAFGYTFFIIGLIILYVSRLTQKMKIRNGRITQAQDLTKLVIHKLKAYIEEDEKELVILQNLANSGSHSQNQA